MPSSGPSRRSGVTLAVDGRFPGGFGDMVGSLLDGGGALLPTVFGSGGGRNESCGGHVSFALVAVPVKLPETERQSFRIDPVAAPPGLLVSGLVEFAMVDGAERNGPLVSRFPSHGLGLHEGQVMCLGWVSATDRTCLSGDVGEMRPVTDAPGMVDCRCHPLVEVGVRGNLP